MIAPKPSCLHNPGCLDRTRTWKQINMIDIALKSHPADKTQQINTTVNTAVFTAGSRNRTPEARRTWWTSAPGAATTWRSPGLRGGRGVLASACFASTMGLRAWAAESCTDSTGCFIRNQRWAQNYWLDQRKWEGMSKRIEVPIKTHWTLGCTPLTKPNLTLAPSRLKGSKAKSLPHEPVTSFNTKRKVNTRKVKRRLRSHFRQRVGWCSRTVMVQHEERVSNSQIHPSSQ